MKIKLKDLSKVKNELLLEIEDLLFESMINLAPTTNNNKNIENVNELSKSITTLIKEKKAIITSICYTDINNSSITIDEAKKIAGMPFRLTKEVLPFILNLISDQMSEESDQDKGKQERPTIITRS